MSSLLMVNDKMNAFNVNTHSGERPLFGILADIYNNYPSIRDDINALPLATLAVERSEEKKYRYQFVEAIQDTKAVEIGDQSKRIS